MTAQQAEEHAGPGRRLFLRGTAGAGMLAAGAVLLAKPGTARANSLQSNWAWCSLCNQVFYAGGNFQGQGDCPSQPADGHANPQGVSFRYAMLYNQPTTNPPGANSYQAGWRWCQYCFSLYWPGSNGYGQCVAGRRANDPHSPGASFNYAVPVNFSGGGYQGGWYWCNACSVYCHGPGFCWKRQASHHAGSSWPYQLIG